MQKQRKRSAAMSLLLLGALMGSSLLCLGLFAVSLLRTVSTSQQLHVESFVPAKRLTSSFEREMLNARISFIYFVTIQKPGTLEKGWQRYHNAESHLAELSTLVDRHAELANLKAPVAKLRSDLASYNQALSATLSLVQHGERKGPRYESQVAEWAARGAVTVGDAAAVESLCFNSGEANTARTVSLVKRGQRTLVQMLCLCVLLGVAMTVWLHRRLEPASPKFAGDSLAAGAPVGGLEAGQAVPHKLQKQW